MIEVKDKYYKIGKVKFDNSQDVSNFVNFISKYTENYYLLSGRYIINAKSIMGIYSLDLSKPIHLVSIKENNEEFIRDFEQQNFKKE